MENILKKIKEFDTIIIHGHIRPDGDCIGTQYGLMYLIKESFPYKNVYLTGDTSEYVSFIGRVEKIDDSLFDGALSICVDTPMYDRLSDNRCKYSKYSIKIDHHNDGEEYADYEYIDSTAASCTQIIAEFFIKFKNELKLSKEGATALYVGLLTDSGKFQYDKVTNKTFLIASELVSHGVDIVSVNNMLSLESENALRLKGHCLNNFRVTENGFAYITLKKEDLEKFGVGEEVAASLVTSISSMKECPMWALIMDASDIIRIRLRSRGPYVNHLANKYHGGGHNLASGGRLDSWDDLDVFVNLCDKLVREYKENLE